SPINSGSGVRVKLLEALSLGVPIITTTIGASGIAFEEAGIVIADTANDFLVAINDLVANEQKKRTIGEKGRNYIATHHQELTIVNQIKTALGN
uniref:glycosyltransferase n=1 Tax=Fluviicola sp. TaxID=1917219 RepID=UPI00404B111A